jgi:transcriptional regulator with XRE-family HTH domain
MDKTIHSRSQKVYLRLLRDARKRAGVTQAELAVRLQATQSFVSKCERGERRIDIIELRRFCQAIGVPFWQFARELDRELQALKE